MAIWFSEFAWTALLLGSVTFAQLLVVCLHCSGQLSPVELAQRIETQVRVTYNIPSTVKVTVSALRVSEFQNYDAVAITFEGEGKRQDFEFLVSNDQKTLIRLTKMDLSKDPYAEVMRKIDMKGRQVRGNPSAKVVLVSYDDFQCPYCSRMHRTLFPDLMREYGDRVAFVYKDFPLSEIHPWAIHAAVDANCLAAQSGDAYWEFADYIHSNQQVINSEKDVPGQFASLDRSTLSEAEKFHLDGAKMEACVKGQNDQAVTASVKEGESLGVGGTPTIFVNGEMINGVSSADEMRAVLDRALERAGVPAARPAPRASTSASQSASSVMSHK